MELCLTRANVVMRRFKARLCSRVVQPSVKAKDLWQWLNSGGRSLGGRAVVH